MAEGPRTSAGRPSSSGETLARLFEAVREGIYVGALGSPSVTRAANPHLKRLFGYPLDTRPAQVRPFDVDRFPSPDERAAFVEQLTRTGRITDQVLRLKRLDDSDVWVEATVFAGPADAEGLIPVHAVVRDVGEQKKFEDQTRDLYHQLLQAEKLAALGQTISGVAHELNNPLATILTWAERLSRRDLDDATRKGLETILAESERAARIVRNLLTFARKRQSTRAMVDLNQVVRRTLALRSYEQRVMNITVLDALADGLPQVFADAHQLQQVLLNLVINAEQAMLAANGQGTLIVRTWYDPEIQRVLLEVNDDGPGVPEAVQGKIFDPFFTTKDVGKGTGLGLTVAYAIVQEHGGQVRLQSRPGEGASFVVEVPTGDAHAETPRTASPLLPLEELTGRSVLIIEDEPKLAAAVTEALTDVGLLVDRAGDGEEGLQRLRQHSYDLIVSDLKMPRLDGQEFYRALETTAPELRGRVIFVTGDVAGTDAEQFLEESGCQWLAKPFRLRDLLRAVQEVLA